ncbi:transglycosylase SLT domain-containing protein (plasmid) [Halopseudomonas sp. SMJS2]|uniref:transglycosylase SLT domain-containing protein n=1 Tax=Halopseudomonas sp. SMJS2 TaxID=3041098 RepID=UPI002452900F|nr:transglycosylase SLT domain-containing protein [Halopseudomonas sp. SMJS2]WGK63517.1 transglycosylase SLT domain-containing protein [Halopseudomonas sp. SMJS2]
MKLSIVAGLLTCLLTTTTASASVYDPLIDTAAKRHGVDRIVLRAIAQQESGKNPWSFNADGEGFKFQSRENAITALYAINSAPWMVKVLPHRGDGAVHRRFFRDSASAQQYLNGYLAVHGLNGKRVITQRTDAKKDLDFGQARVRRLWLLNTDIGIGQISYRFHGQNRVSVQHWFNPAINLDYAASLIAEHKRSTGSDLEAAGLYHSKTPSLRAAYMKRFMPIYRKEVARAQQSLTASH